MSYSRKHLSVWRCSIFDICLGLFIIIFPIILLKNFLFALCYLFILSTVSSLNVISINKRNTPFSFASTLNSHDDARNDKGSSRKTEKKEFSLFKSVIASASSVLIYYILCVLFGAPLFELYASTLYFSSLMTILTIYPLLWYFYSNDNLTAIIRIFSDTKHDNFIESHFHSFAVCSIIGAWIGAFPIPLDWDRPWQTWPITCCIGASLGFAAAHLYMGGKLLYITLKEKRKLTSNRLV